jgi:hypothetical protein
MNNEEAVEVAVAELPADKAVGPESEQVSGASVGETGMGQPTPEPAKVYIPEEHRVEVGALAVAKEEWRLRMKCAESRMEKAISDGDPEKAIIERRILIDSEFATADASTALWDRIRDVTGISANAREFGLNLKTMEVARRQLGGFPFGQ